MICPKCKIVRTESTVHCPVTDKCIDRYDQFSSIANNAVGRGNHGFYFAFMFFLWLDTFLVGWIDYDSFKVTKCELEEGCPLQALCILCNVLPIHYFSTVFGGLVCLLFFIPSQVLCIRHSYYFGIG
jgi:DHHC palmitoyltransferase